MEDNTLLEIAAIFFIMAIICFASGLYLHLTPNDNFLNDSEYKIDTLIHIHGNDTAYEYKFVKISNYEREY